jgi:hypothetical protein
MTFLSSREKEPIRTFSLMKAFPKEDSADRQRLSILTVFLK